MIRAFRSEWLKLLHPATLLGGAGAMVAFAVLTVVLTLRRIGDATAGGPGEGLTAAQLATSDGFGRLLGNSATFLGIVALAIFAIGVASEYANGTLRNLLVRQPARLRLLAGKLLATASFIVLAVALAFGAALLVAVLQAPGSNVDTAAWFSGAGLWALLAAAGNLALSTLAWGALGATLAVALRSTATAITIGMAYVLVVENLLLVVWPDGARWLPGQLIGVVAHGGTAAVSYLSGLALVGLYALAALALAGALFQRWDVAI